MGTHNECLRTCWSDCYENIQEPYKASHHKSSH